MLESELQRKKELVARICVALKRRQEKMIKARSRFKHMARSLYWSVIWPSITSRYSTHLCRAASATRGTRHRAGRSVPPEL